MALVIRPLTLSDLPALEQIQAANPTAAQWPAADYLAFRTLIAELDARPVAFLAVLDIPPDEVEILNIAVHPAQHRQGIATALLRQAGGRVQFLDVRISNHGAIAFYRRHGFEKCGHRRKYYSRPTEDAVMMKRLLFAAPGGEAQDAP